MNHQKPVRRLPCALGARLPRRLLLFRALQLGDMLCAVPALRALRAGLPETEIVLLGLPWAKAFVERFPMYLDGFREFPGFPGLPERAAEIREIPSFLARMQAERFDLVLQMHGSGSLTNPLTMLLGGRASAGFFKAGEYCPDPERFCIWPERGLEVHRLMRLVELLGFSARGDHVEFPLSEADRRALSEALDGEELQAGEYVCIHPGASVAERRWPVERFIEVGRALRAMGVRIVLTGTKAEVPLTGELAKGLDEALDLSDRTNLGALGVLFAQARLLICNDTGVSHIAAGVRTPSVVISTGDNPERWAPVDRRRHRVLCRPESVEPREVLRQAEDLLESFPLRRRELLQGASA